MIFCFFLPKSVRHRAAFATVATSPFQICRKTANQSVKYGSQTTHLGIGLQPQYLLQIDLLIDRADDVVNVCEMKYSKSRFVVTKSYAVKLSSRLSFLENTMPEKTFHMTLVSINGMERNEHSDIFVREISAEDLFR